MEAIIYYLPPALSGLLLGILIAIEIYRRETKK